MATSEQLRLLWKDPAYRQHMIDAHKKYVFTEEHKQNISQALTGKPKSDEHIRHVAQSLSGKKLTQEHRKKLSNAKLNNPLSIQRCKDMALARVGIPLPVSQRLNQSIAHKKLWVGTQVNTQHNKSIEWRLWREAVFARDNWTCQLCGVRGVKLHPHHIKGWVHFPELRYAIDNGMTLCIPCHKLTPNYGRKATRKLTIKK